MKRAFVLVAALCALVLTACGGSDHHPTATTATAATTITIKPKPHTLIAIKPSSKAPAVSARVLDSHACDPKDEALACALPQASLPSAAEVKSSTDPSIQGVDFGWSCPVSSAQSFGASYLSYDTSKDWSASCVNAFHAAHKATVAVWEAGGSDATRGYSLGYSQAKDAAAQLQALGAPSNQPFDMAVNCDCSGASLVGYFQGADKAEPGRVNAYGGYDQVSYLYSQHLVGHLNWQTYAWSGGRWLPASVAPLEQYLNSTSVDYDRAIATNYGQWPGPTPPKPRTICWGKGSTPNSSLCRKIEDQAKHDWQQYGAFHKGLVAHQAQLKKVKGVIFSLQKNKTIVYQSYKGPGLGYLAGRVATETKWSAHFKGLHDGLVKQYVGH